MGRNVRVAWSPFAGGQRKLITCPIWECLMHGNRGGGKTDVLLMDFLQGVGQGYGSDWRGLLLREATTELGDVIAKSKKWFPRIKPGCKYNASKKIWVFPDGETLWFNYARVLDDYDQYHGHEYPWIGWEELTNHAVPEVYLKLMSCNRCSNADVPKRYRSTCNPSGPGHAWVKERFIDRIGEGRVYTELVTVEIPDEDGVDVETELAITRTHVKSRLDENKAMKKADPLYRAKIYQMTEGNEMLRKAWLDGDWDLVMGGFFTDVWDPKIHHIKPFTIPQSWMAFRSFDWGSSKPWAVSYCYESNGVQSPDREHDPSLPFIPKGSVIVVSEIYGWTGVPNEGDQAVSQKIAERVAYTDMALQIEYGLKIYPGPADTSIWDVRDGGSIGTNLASFGCRWTKAYKGSGSRIAGWAIIRQMLSAAKNRDRERPHLYFFPAAQHHVRTLPLQQRDVKKPEDIDTDGEDHLMDGLRYALSRKMLKMKRGKVGM
jgi:hypothetical protein